jgi:hypothetical protein
MVRAILEGRKTQTRRVMSAQPDGDLLFYDEGEERIFRQVVSESVVRSVTVVDHIRCPYGKPGDTLWVRETHALDVPGCEDFWGVSYRADHHDPTGDGPTRIRWRPSIHMPRFASRITLSVVDCHIERLQAITDEDAKAEGVLPAAFCKAGRPAGMEHVEAFEDLWNKINKKRGFPWDSDPLVWVISFERISQ